MKKFRKITALVVSLCMMVSFSACGEAEAEPVKELDDATKEEISNVVAGEELLTGELENKTIKWLSTWDINPDSSGKNVPMELAIFQERYGGVVESKIVAYAGRYDALANAINGDEGIDFFPASDFDAFPKGAIRGMFVPVDDYIDFDSELWADVKEANDALMWNGSHYIICEAITGDNCVVIYNRTTIDEWGFDDPAELYENGEWDWNTFRDMLLEFVDVDEGYYGIDGWFFENGISLTTGVPYIGLENGQLVNNLRDPAIERVQNYMYDLYKSGLILDKSIFSWKVQPNLIGEGKELFYPSGLYELYKEKAQWADTFGEDVFFVPLPKDPEADDYYIPASLDGFVMCKGGHNPEGVAKFADCKRVSLMNETTVEIGKQQLYTEYGWTDEMVDMKYELDEIALRNPIYDFYQGVTADVQSTLEPAVKAATSGTPWAESLGSIVDQIDLLIEEANENPSVESDTFRG